MKKLEITEKKQEIIGKPGNYNVGSSYIFKNIHRILFVITQIKLRFIKKPKKKSKPFLVDI